MSVINTNITSMIGQQNLRESQNALQTSMERLSSGLRINSAKDDAAGQAIANRMSSQITGLSQAQRNANDGISVAQTAEGALNQVNDNLQRIRELSVQAQNGTNSSDDLNSIQDEINQRLSEIDRISGETNFNGTKVLASDNGLKIQVGANDGEAITVNLKEITSETLGLKGFNINSSGKPNTEAAVQDLLAQGFEENAAVPGEYTATGFNTAAAVSDVFAKVSESGATVSDGTTTYTYDAGNDSFSFDEADRADTGGATLASDLTPAQGESNRVTITLGGEEQEVNIDSNGNLTDAANGNVLYLNGDDLSETNAGGGSQATIDDVTSYLAGAAVDDTAGDENRIETADGTIFKANGTADQFDVEKDSITKAALEQKIADERANGAVTANTYTVDLDGNGTTTSDSFTISQDSAAAIQQDSTDAFVSGFDGSTFETSADATVYVNANGKITDGAANVVYVKEDGALTYDAVSGDNKTEDPLATLDSALNQVDSLRSELGAVQNRFESAITNLSTNETNLSAARSRIEDADYAVEVANMTRAQILQQAGTSVLAQANQIPQSVLSLLG